MRNRNYRIWEDGFSPIVFAMPDCELKIKTEDEFIESVLSLSKKICRKLGKCYILINLSSVKFSNGQINFIMKLKKVLDKAYIDAVAVIGFDGLKHKINIDEKNVNVHKMKYFNFFEEALEFINQHRSQYLKTNQ